MRFLFFLSSFFICAQITAQPSLQWYPEQWMPSSNNSSGFSVNLAPLQNFIPENAVKSYFQRYKCKWSTTDKSGLVWKSEPVIVDEISPSTIQIFYSFQKAVDTSKLKILFQSVPNTGETNIPESNYLKLLSSISNRLIYDFYMNKIEQQTKLVKDTQALVKATEGDIDQAKKAIEKSEKEIQNSKQKINELDRDLVQYKTAEGSQLQAIDAEKTFLAANNPDVMQEQIKSLTSENKKLNSDIEKLNKTILDKKVSIQTTETEKAGIKSSITKNDQSIAEIKTKKNAELTSGADPSMVKERVKLLDSQAKDLENENKKLTKDVQKLDETLLKSQTVIENLNASVNNNKLSIY